MSNIAICIYSYQNKKLIDSINNIINKSSGANNLFFYIIDQNNIDRTRSIDIKNKHISILYNYIKWDSIKSPILYKYESLKILNKEYYMQICDDADLIENWDIFLINFINQNNNSIISGNYKYKLYNKNLFFIDKEKTTYNNFYKNNIIDRDFIFGKSENVLKLQHPVELKYYGEEEQMSINAIKNKIDIYSLPTNYLINNSKSLHDEQYVPFSLTHNYNYFIDKNKNDINLYYGLNIERLPFQNDDVDYDLQKSKIDRIGGLRYINKIKEIS